MSDAHTCDAKSVLPAMYFWVWIWCTVVDVRKICLLYQGYGFTLRNSNILWWVSEDLSYFLSFVAITDENHVGGR
jgi:hypothetical protein